MLFYGMQALLLLVATVGLGYMCGRFLRWRIKGVGVDAPVARAGFPAAAPLDGVEADVPRAPAQPGGQGGDVIRPSERVRALAPLVVQDRAGSAVAKAPGGRCGVARSGPAAHRRGAPGKPVRGAAKTAPAKRRPKPFGLTRPRAGGADDLQQISGIGPKIEQTLNGTGVFHFDQIAGWIRADITTIDNKLTYGGRIDREGWIAQAKKLAGQ